MKYCNIEAGGVRLGSFPIGIVGLAITTGKPDAQLPKLSVDRMTLDTGYLSCVFDSGTASDGTLQMRMHCTDPDEKKPSIYGAQLKLQPGKKIELIIEPMDQQ